MNRLILVSLCTLLLTACSLTLPGAREQAKLPTPPTELPLDQRLFMEGLDHFAPQRRTAAFARLQDEFPTSPWAERGQVIAGLAGQLRLQEKQLKRLRQQLAQQATDRQRLQQAYTDLQQKTVRLQENLKVLKTLIVDLELKQP